MTDEFTALISALEQAVVEFAVCGGMAMALHGFPRFTNDIDLLVPGGSFASALAVVRQCGFDDVVEEINLGQESGHRVEIRRITKFQREDHLTLDLILTSAVLEDVWNGRMMFQWQGRRLPVVSAAGLAKMKRLAGRPQDSTFNRWGSIPMIPPSRPDKPPLEAAKRRFEVDMSPAAIDRRLREVGMLWEFWRYLRRFRPVPDVGPRMSAAIGGG